MRVIITHYIENKANKIGISINDIVSFLQTHRGTESTKIEQLCSPIPGTVAFKGYMTNLQRIIIFAIREKGILYPVYIGDKKELLAKNITVEKIRKYADIRLEQTEKEIVERKYKIRHFL